MVDPSSVVVVVEAILTSLSPQPLTWELKSLLLCLDLVPLRLETSLVMVECKLPSLEDCFLSRGGEESTGATAPPPPPPDDDGDCGRVILLKVGISFTLSVPPLPIGLS